MEEKPSTLSSSSCIEPINAVPLRWFPAVGLPPKDTAPSSSSFNDSWLSLGSVNQSPAERKKDSDSETEILLFGFKIKASSSDSSLSVASLDDHQFVQNQNQSCDSRNGIRLFGAWISTEQAASGNKKIRLQESSRDMLQESSRDIKKRAYTRPLFKKRAAEGVPSGSYKENIGELLAEKVLTKSDIDQSSRLLLPSETVKKRLIPILNENYPKAEEHCESLDGLKMEIFDDENGKSYTLVLKQWKTKSFVFTGNWKKDFVKRRNLKEDDQVGLFWDQNQRRFNFSVKQIRS